MSEATSGLKFDMVSRISLRSCGLRDHTTMAKKRKPMHPGEVLREEFLAAEDVGWPACQGVWFASDRIDRIASEQALGTTAQLWLNLQNGYDIQVAKRDLGKVLERIETVNKPKAA
jgi:antitoxin HigA-1